MKFFFICIAETKYLEDIFNLLSQYDEVFNKHHGIRLGILIRFTKWRSCKPCKLAERYNVPLFVDNGAFDYLSKTDLEKESLSHSVLEKWVTRYASWVSTWYPYVTVAAMPDVPVHGREFLPHELRLKRIELTAKLHARFAQLLKRLDPGSLSRVLIVLQGFTVEEYYYSLRLHLENFDVLADTLSLSSNGRPYAGVFGVGSVCVRKPSAKGKTALLAEGKVAGTLAQFMREFLGFDWPRDIRGFHFFGLHTEAVRSFSSHPLYYGSDTGAHGLNYKYKWRTRLKCSSLNKDCYLRAVETQVRLTLSPYLNKPIHAKTMWHTQNMG